MFALIIIFLIVAFLLILTFIPVYINVTVKKELKINLKYLFIKVELFKENNKKTTNSKKAREKSSIESIRETFKTDNLSEFIDMIKEISKIAMGIFKRLFSHIIIDNIYMDIVVVGADAADTAINYGQACASIFPATNIVTNITNCKKKSISITPGFDEESSKIELLIKFHIKPIFVIFTAVVTAVNYIKWVMKTK